MSLARIGNNALVIVILFGFGYLIYRMMKDDNFRGLSEIKSLFRWGKK